MVISFQFGFSSVFEKKLLIQFGKFGSVWFEKNSDIIVIYYLLTLE